MSLALLTEQVTLSKQSIASGWWSAQFASFTPQDVALVLLFSLIASLIILTVYRRTFKGVIYNPTFGTTLILLTLVTGPVVMAIGSNVALSMGMVGALSIVRFRTAVKEPVDTAYMFWAITMGIIIGTKSYVIAMGVVIGISIIMLGLSMFRSRAMLIYDHHEYFSTALGYKCRKVSIYPAPKSILIRSRSSSVNPAFLRLVVGFLRSISACATFKSPQSTIGFFAFSALI